LAKTLTLCLDRWADIQVERAIQESSPSRALAHPDLTGTHLKLSTPLRSATSLGVFDGPSSAVLIPPVHPQQPENQPSALLELTQLESRHRGFPLTDGLNSAVHIAPFLIVDDNRINIKLLSTYLSRKSYPFTTAADGVLAVEAYKAARGNFSCVFMDIQMPHMNGIEATRAIREYERREHLPAITVVALTGLATEENQREAEAIGINEFFAKPVRLKALDVILKRTAKAIW
jgi:CheY-like chemotaxis protein